MGSKELVEIARFDDQQRADFYEALLTSRGFTAFLQGDVVRNTMPYLHSAIPLKLMVPAGEVEAAAQFLNDTPASLCEEALPGESASGRAVVELVRNEAAVEKTVAELRARGMDARVEPHPALVNVERALPLKAITVPSEDLERAWALFDEDAVGEEEESPDWSGVDSGAPLCPRCGSARCTAPGGPWGDVKRLLRLAPRDACICRDCGWEWETE